MCTKVTDHLKAAFPKYTVERYCDDDPYSNLIEPQIRVSTPGSASTAHDIKGLSCTVQTVQIRSIQSLLQSFGRLREPKGEYSHIQTKYYHVYNNTEKRHRDMKLHAVKELKPKSKKYADLYYPGIL